VTDASGFTSQHTHNALLDLLLGIGIPGALAYALIVLIAMKSLLVLFKESHSVYHAGALALLIPYALHNFFVSVHLAAQLQTFVALMIIAKVGFVRAGPATTHKETEVRAVTWLVQGAGNHAVSEESG